MPLPLIGITTYGRNEEDHYHLPAAYVEAVRRAGGVPILVPPGEPQLERALECVDAIILAGGGDVDPATYGQEPHASVDRIDPERDRTEMAMTRLVLEREVPSMFVCRGMQLLNVSLGGSLIQDLAEVNRGDMHRVAPRTPVRHTVTLEPESFVARLCAVTECRPVSWHHQAIDVLAAGLRITARAPDGVIEAVELEAHPWLLAVQWHPELSAAEDVEQQRLFDALVLAARGHRASREQSGGSACD